MNIDPREFEQQERALREDAGYREVARALRRAPGEPPTDFAASVAALAAAEAAPVHAQPAVALGRTASAHAADGVLERRLLRALAVAFAASGAVVAAIYGREWLGGFAAMASALGGSTALNWVLAVAACVALSWAFAQGSPGFGRRSTPDTRSTHR